MMLRPERVGRRAHARPVVIAVVAGLLAIGPAAAAAQTTRTFPVTGMVVRIDRDRLR